MRLRPPTGNAATKGGRASHTYGVYHGRQENSITIGYWPEKKNPQVRSQERKGRFKRWLERRGAAS